MQWQRQGQEQGNRRLHFAHAVHSRHHLPADRRCGLSSTCRRRTEHRHRQYAQKIAKIARVVPEISWWTDRRRQTDILITILRNGSRARAPPGMGKSGGTCPPPWKCANGYLQPQSGISTSSQHSLFISRYPHSTTNIIYDIYV